MVREFINDIVKKGKIYIPALLPEYIDRGKVGDCFDHCFLEAYKHPELRYVEGIATIPRTKFENPDLEDEYLLHAWLTDGVHAFDPTWTAWAESVEIPVPSHYIGIEIATKDVLKFIKKTGYKGILANSHRDRSLAQEILKIK